MGSANDPMEVKASRVLATVRDTLAAGLPDYDIEVREYDHVLMLQTYGYNTYIEVTFNYNSLCILDYRDWDSRDPEYEITETDNWLVITVEGAPGFHGAEVLIDMDELDWPSRLFEFVTETAWGRE